MRTWKKHSRKPFDVFKKTGYGLYLSFYAHIAKSVIHR